MAVQELISDQLRRAVRDCGLTRYQISQTTGIAQSVLSRFMHKKGGLSLDSIDLVCATIGARLVLDAKQSKQKGK